MHWTNSLISIFGLTLGLRGLEAQSAETLRPRSISASSSVSLQSTWRIDERPRIQIGSATGSGASLFNRIVGVARLSSGAIVVADGSSGELRIFDASGTHVRTVGRPGSGPGEFRQLFNLYLGPADSLIAYDVVQGFQVFDSSGRYHRTISYGRGTSMPLRMWPYGWFFDGHQLAGRITPREQLASGRVVDTMTFYRVSPKGEKAEEVFRSPAFEFAGVTSGRRLLVVYSPSIAVAVWPKRFCVGYGATYEIHCKEIVTGVSKVLRLDVKQQPVPPGAVERYKEMVRSEPVQGSAFIPQPLRVRREELLRMTTYAKYQPAFSQFVAATSGELWVRRYDLEIDAPLADALQQRSRKPSEWDVFNANGRWVATVRLPARFRLFQAGADYVLGVRVDDDDVEQVVLLSIRR